MVDTNKCEPEITDFNVVDHLNAKPKDCETISANTEDSLLPTTTTNSISKGSLEDSCYTKQKQRNTCGSYCGLITGIVLTTLGILMLIRTPFHIFMEERLNMIPGLPPFEWWKTPPDEVLFKVYIFNVTNSEAFNNGIDEKMNVEEIGPIIYLEKLRHVNVTHNDNGTLTYTAVRTAVYLPEYNDIDLNKTIIVPNYAVLGMASFLSDSSFLTKIGFNMLYRTVDSPLFINSTIYNFLWNLSDPILSVAKNIAPGIVPSENIGVLDTIYRDFTDQVTVYIGRENGDHKFFLIDKYHGSEFLPGHGSECSEKIVNSTEGALYPQYISKDMELKYWRKTLCRPIPLRYTGERFMDNYNVMAYKFMMLKTAFDRKANLNDDCHKGEPSLPSGLSDVSKCFHGIPNAASNPHFLYGSEETHSYVTGLKPNSSAHVSFTYVEPHTGIPIESVARSQSNMIMKDLSGFSTNFHKFSNIAIPMFWIEYNQAGLPYYIRYLIIFTVNILPIVQWPFIAVFLAVGSAMLVIYFKRIRYSKRTNNNRTNGQSNYKKNVNLHYEQETFIKQS